MDAHLQSPVTNCRLTPEDVLEIYHLEIRCKILEIAATFDRYQRAGGPDPARSPDPRLQRCSRALALLAGTRESPDRAERIALLFSDPE